MNPNEISNAVIWLVFFFCFECEQYVVTTTPRFPYPASCLARLKAGKSNAAVTTPIGAATTGKNSNAAADSAEWLPRRRGKGAIALANFWPPFCRNGRVLFDTWVYEYGRTCGGRVDRRQISRAGLSCAEAFVGHD